MTNDPSGLFSGRCLRVFGVLMGLLLMAGCSSAITRIQTWDGNAVRADQAAVLSAPSSINVKEVNGQPMKDFLMEDLALDYELLPGDNQIVFTYKTIWAKNRVVDNGESKVYVVETAPQSVTLAAEPGASYRFEVQKPESRQQAEAMAKDFSTAVVNTSGETVATSTLWVPSETGRLARAPVPDSRAVEMSADGSAAGALAQLKSLWGEASEEEKREFLRWAFE